MIPIRRLKSGVQTSDDKFNIGTSLPANDCCRRVLPLHGLLRSTCDNLNNKKRLGPWIQSEFVCKKIGSFSYDEDPPLAYSQIFVLKPIGATCFYAYDIFRLNIHNSAQVNAPS
uniref:Uncharacterized protein n=1 Tax=Glossina pallidipes TaxID=7398 RepID=A0A1A9Z4C3_GLOPL